MSDIIERLRAIAKDAEPDDAGWCAVMREAADEIEQLRRWVFATSCSLQQSGLTIVEYNTIATKILKEWR